MATATLDQLSIHGLPIRIHQDMRRSKVNEDVAKDATRANVDKLRTVSNCPQKTYMFRGFFMINHLGF